MNDDDDLFHDDYKGGAPVEQDGLLGKVIAERYRLDSILGAGGMGAVYQATQLNLGRPVAVKLLHGAPAAHATEAAARFEREARVTAALHHPNAVKIFDFGKDAEGRLFLVMERLEGTTLRSFVNPESPPLPLSRTIDIGMQIADVLIAAHAINLVHRDLKPENIFLEKHQDGSDRVVVVDFGLAYIEDRPDANRMTQEGLIAGTPFYMAPEQCSAQHIGTPADVYALGCMLYEMTTATLPFDGPSFVLLTKHVYEEPIRPARRRADVYVPTSLDQLIVDMLSKAPDARPTAQDVCDRLARIALTLGERERARGRELLEGRAARMIPTVRSDAERDSALPEIAAAHANTPVRAREVQSPRPAVEVRAIALVGEPLSSDLDMGLRVNGFVASRIERAPLPAGCVAILAPGANDAVLRELLAFGLPVLTDAAPDDFDHMARLVAMGIADVVPQPLSADSIASKLKRALKKHARRQ